MEYGLLVGFFGLIVVLSVALCRVLFAQQAMLRRNTELMHEAFRASADRMLSACDMHLEVKRIEAEQARDPSSPFANHRPVVTPSPRPSVPDIFVGEESPIS